MKNAEKRNFSTKELIVVTLIGVLLLASIVKGFAGFIFEDTERLERDLYYDFVEFTELGTDFMAGFLEDFAADYQISRRDRHMSRLDDMVEILENIESPRHLKNEVDEWKDSAYGVIDHLRDLVNDPMSVPSMTNSQLQVFESGQNRIVDGFEEFNPRR